MLVRPVIDFRHSAENGSAKSRTKSIEPEAGNASIMRSACAWNWAIQCDFTARGETAGKNTLRSAMCAGPSLRIMLWPISLFIRPCGWCELDKAVCFYVNKIALVLQ